MNLPEFLTGLLKRLKLHALWPFQLYGVGRPGLGIGVETFRHRQEKASFGWQYDGQSAAIVGLADEARRILPGKTRNSHPGFRFPAMWGPNDLCPLFPVGSP
jgi:hypothetical protein